MTRSIPGIISFQVILLLAAGCGPESVKPRPPVAPLPLPDAAPADVGSPGWIGLPPGTDAGSSDWVGHPPAMDAGGVQDTRKEAPPDAGTLREKLPAPDGGIPGPAVDAGVDAETIDAGVEAVSVRPPVAGEIVIAEVLVNPTGTDVGREWIEIVNRAAEPLDLTDLHVADLAAEVPAPAGIIAPGARVVLGQSADPGANGGAPITVAYGTRLALNNDGEEIAICIGTCASGVVIDRLSWKTLGAGYDGHALVVDHDAGGLARRRSRSAPLVTSAPPASRTAAAPRLTAVSEANCRAAPRALLMSTALPDPGTTASPAPLAALLPPPRHGRRRDPVALRGVRGHDGARALPRAGGGDPRV